MTGFFNDSVFLQVDSVFRTTTTGLSSEQQAYKEQKTITDPKNEPKEHDPYHQHDPG